MRSYPAFYQYTGWCLLRPLVCSGNGLCHKSPAESHGDGTLLAFPGIHVRALICGLLYRYTQKLPLAYLGELFGTSVIGGILSYPVSVLLMGNSCAVFAFVLPFFISSFGGTLIAIVLVTALKRTKILDIYLEKPAKAKKIF